MKVLLKRFHLNGLITVFLLQTKKLEQCTKQIVRDESTVEEVSFEWFWNCEINLLIKTFFGLVEMIFGLVNVSFSLPEWQAVKMTFFAPRAEILLLFS